MFTMTNELHQTLTGDDIPGHFSNQLGDLPGRVLTEDDVLCGSIVGRTTLGRLVVLVDVVDPEPPGLYGAWGVYFG